MTGQANSIACSNIVSLIDRDINSWPKILPQCDHLLRLLGKRFILSCNGGRDRVRAIRFLPSTAAARKALKQLITPVQAKPMHRKALIQQLCSIYSQRQNLLLVGVAGIGRPRSCERWAKICRSKSARRRPASAVSAMAWNTSLTGVMRN